MRSAIISYASTLRENKRQTVIKRLTLVASESRKIERRANRPCGVIVKSVPHLRRGRRKVHLRPSKKTFRSTTNALLMMTDADANAEGPLANAPRFARTNGRGRLCYFNCVLTTVQLDDGGPCNLQFRLYPIKTLPRLTRRPSDFCERADRLFFRGAQFTTPTTGKANPR